MSSLKYIAIEINDASQLRALTPRVMQWKDNIWLLDLTPCRKYWCLKARQSQKEVMSLVRCVLQRLVPHPSGEEEGRKEKINIEEGNGQVGEFSLTRRDERGHRQREFVDLSTVTAIGEAAGYAAVHAPNPWLAVLLLHHMQERQIGGLTDFSSSSGQKMFQDTSWASWWRACAEIGEHWAEQKRPRFQISNYRTRCAQMQKAVERLSQTTPWALSMVEGSGGRSKSLAVNKRFGAHLAELWGWAFDEEPGRPFPWQSYQYAESPRTERHLDHAVWEWTQIEAFLIEDFDRLCRSFDSLELAVGLEWRLTFHDLTYLTIPVNFRNPHSLHQETGHHKTAVLQAYYSFLSEKGLQPDVEDEGVETRPIIGWQLTLTERICLSQPIKDLFGEFDQSIQDLFELENKLPVELEEYDLVEDWQPEDSFQRCQQGGRELEGCQNEALHAVASGRPLYISEPILYDNKGNSSGWKFLERVTTKWWRPRSQLCQTSWQRDYFQLIDAKNRKLWVFRDNLGRWYVHGVFG